MKKSLIPFFILIIAAFSSCKTEKKESSLSIPFEKYTLANGLTVVLNEDKSDPIAAVAILYHVGSARESTGKTGFAHLFRSSYADVNFNISQEKLFNYLI